MQIVLIISCFICNVSLLFTALYAGRDQVLQALRLDFIEGSTALACDSSMTASQNTANPVVLIIGSLVGVVVLLATLLFVRSGHSSVTITSGSPTQRSESKRCVLVLDRDSYLPW